MCVKLFRPIRCYQTIFDIDYDLLKEENRKYIIFDLDNTIIPYSEGIPNQKCLDLMKSLKEKGFVCLILSNNHNERLRIASNTLGLEFMANAMKPFKRGYKRIIKKYNVSDPRELVAIGDQLITDVLGARRTNIDTILVKAIDRSGEHFYTRFNRRMENLILKRLKKKDNNIYQEIIKVRGEK